jgi:serine/threonine-protein phosphatase 2A activator
MAYTTPVKKIFDGPDVQFFRTSMAYRDLMAFMLQLNHSVVPRKETMETCGVTAFTLTSQSSMLYSEPIKGLRGILGVLSEMVDRIPPETGPRRFGNVAFRTWYKCAEEQMAPMLEGALESRQLDTAAVPELEAYLLGSFGSPQRLDYGTGHELSLLAFLCCLWKIGFFEKKEPGVEERDIVLAVFQTYLILIRKLITTYNLEPAGSHGVWGLDDNSFLPYIFGSAQLCPPIDENDLTPTEGSLTNAPDLKSVAQQNLVEKEKDENMYFSAVAFIYDVKKGPFWEHSPILFDISGVPDGWGKINKGMIKMYVAEVLSKFPVVQHFPFGSLLRWEKDPDAKELPVTTHTTSQPLRDPIRSRPAAPPMASTAAPWAARGATAKPIGFVDGATRAPWTGQSAPLPPTRTVWPPQKSNSRTLPSLNENTKDPDTAQKLR